jgi:hypothetical protein
MSSAFYFMGKVNPHKPLDPADPPPVDWDTGIHPSTWRAALSGSPSKLLLACQAWEIREGERIRKVELMQCTGNPS